MTVSKRERDVIVALHRGGVPSSHIARKLGIDRAKVNWTIKRWCLDG